MTLENLQERLNDVKREWIEYYEDDNEIYPNTLLEAVGFLLVEVFGRHFDDQQEEIPEEATAV